MDMFKIKNLRRREEMAIAIRNGRKAEVRDSRRRRRFYDGAFGNLPNEDYNQLAIGTSGQHRRRGV